ncbi:AAA family ATPase [Kribbella sp. NPDC050820]|uniref:ATP-binding protein n=1 Tax=Kribbella sp. NPDC050820 TaxID=3155408 RepID=UPI0033F79A67
MTPRRSGAGLIGRLEECRALDDLLEDARAGHSAALVLRGEAGIGKTELLKYLLDSSAGHHVLRAAGVQSEMELSYAGVHQLCAPLLTGLDQLPGPQRDALATAFGLRAGNAPDRFLVGLAVLSLLADAAGNQPLVCLVDDAQWLDEASALTLGFVARRLLAESVLLVFAVREPTPVKMLPGLPELAVKGLSDRDSRTLLGSVVTGPLDQRVRDRIIAESRGNPLALLELPHGWTAAEPVGHPEARPVSSQIEKEFLRRVGSLPIDTRRLMFTAAAEPVGDVRLLRLAAERLGIDVETAAADASELMTLDSHVRFRHPLVRSAVYRATPLEDRQTANRALAESIDGDVEPDRRAWHRAQGAPGPDEDVAAELERSAVRAQARGGLAAVAAFLERASDLTQDPGRRSQRALAAAGAKFQAGAFEAAAALLATATAGRPDELTRARIDVLHAGLAFAQGRGTEAPPLLLTAARRLEPLDVALARETYLEAVSAAIFASHLAHSPGWREVGEAAREAPPAELSRATDQLLDALAVRLTDGFAASAPMVERVLTAFCDDDVPVQESMRWLLLAGVIAADLWDLERWDLVTSRHVMLIRDAGALSELPLALDSSAVVHVFAGDLAAASSMVEEVRTVSTAIGSNQPPFGALALAAVRGHEEEARTLIEGTISGATQHGQGLGVTVAHFHHAVLCNGLAQYKQAMAAAQASAAHQEQFGAPQWALAELIEAATRSGASKAAYDAFEQLTETTQASGTDWALGVEARSRALLSEGAIADTLYREAIERLSRTRVRVNLARAHLLYGEWLRREGHRVDARTQLGIAHDMLSRIGADAFAERARRALQAAGAKVRKRAVETSTALTAQEAQIARLAGDGLTNADIGARLFLSPHTVEWHLRKVYSKLGIASRREIPTFTGASGS